MSGFPHEKHSKTSTLLVYPLMTVQFLLNQPHYRGNPYTRILEVYALLYPYEALLR